MLDVRCVVSEDAVKLRLDSKQQEFGSALFADVPIQCVFSAIAKQSESK